VVVLIDERTRWPDAQRLEGDRLLSNLESQPSQLLQIVLFGQPEFDEHLDAAAMRQLRERITHTASPGALVRQRHRELHRLSHARRRLPPRQDFQS